MPREVSLLHKTLGVHSNVGLELENSSYIFIYSIMSNIYISHRCNLNMLTSRRRPPTLHVADCWEAESLVTTSKPGAISNNSIYWVLKLLWIPLECIKCNRTTPLCLPSAMSLSQRSTGCLPGLVTRTTTLISASWDALVELCHQLHIVATICDYKKSTDRGTAKTGTKNS